MRSCTIQQEGFPPRSHLCPQLTNSHSPHACPTLGVYTFTVTQSIGCYTSLSGASTTGRIRNSQSSVAVTGLPLGELTSSTHSLTWRELLTCLTTCFFYSRACNPLLHSRSSTHEHGDGSNRNWTWGTVLSGQYVGNPQGTGATRVSIRLIAEVQGVSGIPQWHSKVSVCLLGALVNLGNRWPAWLEWSECPPINLHAFWMTLGSPEARFPPLGTCSSS
jgi:hypothetical protein